MKNDTLRDEPYKQMVTQLHAQCRISRVSPFLFASMIDVVNPEVITQRRDRNIIFVQGNSRLTFLSTHLETILQGKK